MDYTSLTKTDILYLKKSVFNQQLTDLTHKYDPKNTEQKIRVLEKYPDGYYFFWNLNNRETKKGEDGQVIWTRGRSNEEIKSLWELCDSAQKESCREKNTKQLATLKQKLNEFHAKSKPIHDHLAQINQLTDHGTQ